MHFIKEIFLGKEISEGTHWKFIRYGRGIFGGPFIKIKKSGKSIKIVGTEDYVGVLGEIILRNCKRKFSSTGKIFSKGDKKTLLEQGGINIKKEKKKGSRSVYEISGTLSSEELLKIYEKLSEDYVLLDLTFPVDKKKWNLKTKKNLPKAGKVDRKFFTANLDVSALPILRGELFWDNEKEFKEMEISHSYFIDELIIPEEYKNNFKEARIHAKRKGRIKRIVIVNGVKEEKKVDLLV